MSKTSHLRQVKVYLPKDMEIDAHGLTVTAYVKRLIQRDQEQGAVRWIVTVKDVRCPSCMTAYPYTLYSQPIAWRFCPTCGALVLPPKADKDTDSP